MDFDSFKTTLLELLNRRDFPDGLTYLEYLSRPLDQRRGDEANVVDQRLVPVLLDALGYPQNLRTYNQLKDGNKPDWQVRLSLQFPPYFLVESKATSEVALAPHLSQLTRYMRESGTPRGLLFNGDTILGYELRNQEPAPILALSLSILIRDQNGQGGDLFPDLHWVGLEALYLRFHHDRLSIKPQLISELIRTRSGEYHARDGHTWPSESAIPVLDATVPGFLGRFTDDVKGLLVEIARDVTGQLNSYRQARVALEDQAELLPDGTRIRDEATAIRRGILNHVRPVLEDDAVERLDALLAVFPWESDDSMAEGLSRRVTQFLTGLPSSAFKGNTTPGGPQRKTGKRKLMPEVRDNVLARADHLEQMLRLYVARRTELNQQHAQIQLITNAFDDWKHRYAAIMMPSATENALMHEFAVQTAYVLFIRLLLVRIAEDKGLLRRMFTNGGITFWLSEVEPYYLGAAQGASTLAFLDLVFQRTQEVYSHFFADHTYDWYRPEPDLVIRLLHRLGHYNFQRIDHDVIGNLYTHYVSEEHRHQSGMYYTPPAVVDFILDRVGIRGHQALNRTILDPACGSGTFLVRAARRILEAWAETYNGTIPPGRAADVVASLQDSLYGLDLNPFACYLAEINLLVQVMDLLNLAQRAGHPVRLDRFHIYNTDALLPADDVRLLRPPPEWPLEERIKDKQWPTEGFDFVVGNPPYVRADEEGVQEYRHRVREKTLAPIRDTLHMKWDLFVPFVALGTVLLRPSGRLGMITSDAIEVVPYASALRAFLLRYRLLYVDFFPDVRLFNEANVHNTIITVEKNAPDGQSVQRTWHVGLPLTASARDTMPIQDGELVFRQDRDSRDTSAGMTLGDICYIQKGMVLSANEKTHKGAFKVEHLISDHQDAQHPVPYVEGKDIEPFGITRLRWLEYGDLPQRAPGLVSRPTFPELWDRPKLVVQRGVGKAMVQQGQAVWDHRQYRHYLHSNHTVTIVIRWADLKGIDNGSIGLPSDGAERQLREQQSRAFEYGYLTALINSRWASEFFRNHRTSNTDLYPDVLKTLPVPAAPPVLQRRITKWVQFLQGLEWALGAWGQKGWRINRETRTVHPPSLSGSLTLIRAEVGWGLKVLAENAPVQGLARQGHTLYIEHMTRKLEPQRIAVAQLDPQEPAEALEWFVQAARDVPSSRETWRSWRSYLMVPRTPQEAATLWLEAQKRTRALRAALILRQRLWDRVNLAIDTLAHLPPGLQP